MALPEIKYCPGTLAENFSGYSRTCLKRVFLGKKVHHILAYESPSTNPQTDELYAENRQRISISGVQEKFLMVLEKNKLRLAHENEKSQFILKPIPQVGKKSDQMPANEHLTMQIARQVYGIETAENALIFFKNGTPAFITKRFDRQDNGVKLAQDDFASLGGKTPQTHGENYKYTGNYLELFFLMKKYLPAYRTEALKLLKILLFNFLFSNGDAHLKNFSLLETPMGDYRFSPAYDLLNSRIHIEDKDFALDDGLLPKNMAKGKTQQQFAILARAANINEKIYQDILITMLNQSDKVENLVKASFLNKSTKRNYWQAYQRRLKRLSKM